MVMTPHRQGEIARILLKHKLQKEGLPLCSRIDFQHQIRETAQQVKIDEHELMEFVQLLTREMVAEMLGTFK